VETIFY